MKKNIYLVICLFIFILMSGCSGMLDNTSTNGGVSEVVVEESVEIKKNDGLTESKNAEDEKELASKKENITDITEKTSYPKRDSYFITIDELKEKINSNEELIIIDTRKTEKYNTSHIKGSINLMWEELSYAPESKPHTVSDYGELFNVETLKRILANKGIAMDSEIVVYSDNYVNNNDMYRTVWSLEACGYENISILKDTYTSYALENETTNEVERIYSVTVNFYELNKRYLATVKDVGEEGYVIIDTRSKEAYKDGHIPGALSFPTEVLLNEKGNYKSQSEIDTEMEILDIGKDDSVIAYSDYGVKSAQVTIILTEAGYNVKNYDGSIEEYFYDMGLPLVE
ncbi:MAG: sulfurtransferase [Lachnospirales bacterium]